MDRRRATHSGSEAARPAAAPVGVRFGLALFGLVMSVVGLVVLLTFGSNGWAVAGFGALALITALDATVQARRMRPHRPS